MNQEICEPFHLHDVRRTIGRLSETEEGENMPGVCPQPFRPGTLHAFHLIQPTFDLSSLLLLNNDNRNNVSREEETLSSSPLFGAAGSTASQMLHLNEVWGVI